METYSFSDEDDKARPHSFNVFWLVGFQLSLGQTLLESLYFHEHLIFVVVLLVFFEGWGGGMDSFMDSLPKTSIRGQSKQLYKLLPMGQR